MQWLDFPFDCSQPLRDAEWRGLDFLSEDDAARRAWADFWPQTGNVPNWDAVGRANHSEQTELLLVEAKAHVGELRSECGASARGGLPRIRRALDEARLAFGSGVPVENWLAPHYQYCNRLAVLHFLEQHDIAARLVFLYFTGDKNPHGDCPRSEDEWLPALAEMHSRVGLTGASALERRVHQVFLAVQQ